MQDWEPIRLTALSSSSTYACRDGCILILTVSRQLKTQQQFVGLDFAIDFPKLDRSLTDKAGGISAAMSYPAFETRPHLQRVGLSARSET